LFQDHAQHRIRKTTGRCINLKITHVLIDELNILDSSTWSDKLLYLGVSTWWYKEGHRGRLSRIYTLTAAVEILRLSWSLFFSTLKHYCAEERSEKERSYRLKFVNDHGYTINVGLLAGVSNCIKVLNAFGLIGEPCHFYIYNCTPLSKLKTLSGKLPGRLNMILGRVLGGGKSGCVVKLKLKFPFFYNIFYIDNSRTRARFTLLATCR